ncbi:M64 family metallopeptidase [Marinicella rhabdoformis]|uniref:M64 family metallopeptidase n=1 Tax=Marinicella rhabdoformis TaxID=2580566 RepID=UPI0012AEC01D|nr:M64 family metallopeptidase [Marinicella rhabdoformis]
MKALFLGLMMACGFTVHADPFDYMVFQWTASDGLSLYSLQEVNLPAPKSKPQTVKSSDYVAVENHFGEVIQFIDLKRLKVQRSEHHGFNHIADSSFEQDQLTFVVRTPKGQAQQLRLNLRDQPIEHLYAINEMTSGIVAKKTGSKKSQGSIDNRINLLFMGDGYLINQTNTFDQHADAVMSYMHSFEPYASYGHFISFDRLFLESAQQGADHPTSPCGGVTDPQAPLFVNTRFDATYCTSGIHRLLTVNSSKIYTDAALSPNWDEIVVLVNDGTYGGSGGGFSTISAHALATDVFIHEFGHSFTDLADEYDSAYPGFPTCSDINGPDCEANVTDVTSRNNLKWNYFVSQSTPVPTPDTQQYSQVTGLFEGARYFAAGMYRPVSACNMRYLGSPFCPVCQQAFVQKVFQVPYGSGNALLNLIEPGSAVPVNNQASVMMGDVLNLSVDSLQPTHDLSFTWEVAGGVVSSYDSNLVTQDFDFVPTQNQVNTTVTVKVTVKDLSPLVHSSIQPQLPVFEHTWQVDVMPFTDLIFKHGFDN